MKTIKAKTFFSIHFVPHYGELSLFSMGYIFILLIFFNFPESSWDFSSWSDNLWAFFIFLPFIIGMLLCMYHAFTDRKKTDLEKKIMIFFAAILNGFIGIWYGTYILEYSSGWELAVFPIWNIISGYILINSLRSDSKFAEKTISDENVSLKKLLLGIFLITIVFLICQIYFRLIWAATFSICMVWIGSLDRVVNSTLTKLEISIY